MSRHTIKTYLERVLRIDPFTGEERKEGNRQALNVDGAEIFLDEIHNDFILGTPVMFDPATKARVPVVDRRGKVNPILLSIANIRFVRVLH